MKQNNRRQFFKVCGAYVAALASSYPTHGNSATTRQYAERVQLMRDKKPIGFEDFQPGQTYIFNYPYVTTPCMIFNVGNRVDHQIKLTMESGEDYVWPGGAGPDHSIVCYSAICAHRMTYPAKAVSFINYRHSKVVYFDEDRNRQEREKIIYCCSERSVYDPRNGGKVLGGPAPQPIATILLEYDENENSFYASGALGGTLFEKFMDEFEFRLQLDFKVNNVRTPTLNQVELLTADEYSEVIVHC